MLFPPRRWRRISWPRSISSAAIASLAPRRPCGLNRPRPTVSFLTSAIAEVTRPRNPRQPWQSHRRGRGRAGQLRRGRPRGRAVGASTGAHEAVELRDGDGERYGGKGVLKAVATVNGEIARSAAGLDALEQTEIDRGADRLDGTPNKDRLGANAILGVSLAVAKAAAMASRPAAVPLRRRRRRRVLPVPMINVINGGAHADNPVDIQEFMVMPVGVRQLRRGAALGRGDLPHAEEGRCTTRGLATDVGDEGGFAPNLASDRRGARLPPGGHREGRLHAAARTSCSRSTARRASSSRTGKYELRRRGPVARPPSMVDYLDADLVRHATRSCRSRTAWPRTTGRAGRPLTDELGSKVQLVGDDLFVTNPARLAQGIERRRRQRRSWSRSTRSARLTETLEAVAPRRSAHGYTAVMSHRCGETEDATIADLAVATNCGPDQDRRTRAAPTASPSTTSCCASRSSSAPRPLRRHVDLRG